MRRRVAGKGSRGRRGGGCATTPVPPRGGCARGTPPGQGDRCAGEGDSAPRHRGSRRRGLEPDTRRRTRGGNLSLGSLKRGPAQARGPPLYEAVGHTAEAEAETKPVSRKSRRGALHQRPKNHENARKGGGRFPPPPSREGAAHPRQHGQLSPCPRPLPPAPSSPLATAEPGSAGAGRPDRSHRPDLSL